MYLFTRSPLIFVVLLSIGIQPAHFDKGGVPDNHEENASKEPCANCTELGNEVSALKKENGRLKELYSDSVEENKQLKTKIRELVDKNASLEENLDGERGRGQSVASQETALSELQGEIYEGRAEIAKLNESIKELEEDNQNLGSKNGILTEELKNLREENLRNENLHKENLREENLRNENLRKEIDRIEEANGKKDAKIGRLKEKKENLGQEIKSLQRLNEGLQAKISNLEQEKSGLEQEVQKLDGKMQVLQASLEQFVCGLDECGKGQEEFNSGTQRLRTLTSQRLSLSSDFDSSSSRRNSDGNLECVMHARSNTSSTVHYRGDTEYTSLLGDTTYSKQGASTELALGRSFQEEEDDVTALEDTSQKTPSPPSSPWLYAFIVCLVITCVLVLERIFPFFPKKCRKSLPSVKMRNANPRVVSRKK